MPPTLTLTERSPTVARLAPDDVACLLAQHRAHVDVAPTGRPHRYRLTARGYTGTIALPNRRLVLLPKIPLRNVLYLLDPESPFLPAGERGALAECEPLDVLAVELARRVEERARAGLARGYAERQNEGPYLVGRLDLPAQARESPARKDVLHCRHDDFTPDVPANQLPRAVVEALLAGLPLGATARQALQAARAALVEIASVPLSADLLARAERSPGPPEQRPLLELCRWIAEGLAPGVGAGTAPAFLLDLERLFEGHLTRGLVEAFAGRPGWRAAVQQAHVIRGTGPDVLLRPDVVLERQNGPPIVVDAKWKRLPGSAVVTDDLYQVLAYATTLGAELAVLVYPGRRLRVFEHRFGPVCVQARTLNVAGRREACARALRRLGRDLLSAGGA
jgi:5-methylcytosine-specific restriction enzyme subunit McrC